MNARALGIVAAAAVVLALGATALWLSSNDSPSDPGRAWLPDETPDTGAEAVSTNRQRPAGAAAPAAASSARVQPPAPEPGARDVPGLPALFPEGMDHPRSEITIDQYFGRFGGGGVIDPETRAMRGDVAETLREELVGKRVTWDGYVQRVAAAPSGRVLLVISVAAGAGGLESAMIRFSAAWSDHIHGYQPGDRVRVVGVYDKVVAVFPSLRGISVEALPAEG